MSVERTEAAREWAIHAAIIALVIYLYVFMEWLFFVTKPSFMTGLGLFWRLRVLLVAPVPLVAAGVAASLALWLPAFATRSRVVRRISSAASVSIAAATLAALLFLLVNNFTLTVLHFGVRTAAGVGRLAYLVFLVCLLALSYRTIDGFRARCARPAPRRATLTAAALLVAASVTMAVVALSISPPVVHSLDVRVTPLAKRPNVVLLSCDGLNAGHLSVYGYRRQTTPFLDFMAGKALLCENCFANADVSMGSIASIFTGKLPTRTRVYYPPEMLTGKDAYEHLPGILRKHGYRNVDVSDRHYTDPIGMNMRESFDEANFRRVRSGRATRILESVCGRRPTFFLGAMRDRLTKRLLHILGVRRMRDPRDEVAPTDLSIFRDAKRVEAMFSFIDEKPGEPFFAHLHLLSTHGPVFLPGKRMFSAGMRRHVEWSVDEYDDAIRELDERMKGIVRGLAARGIAGNTVIVVCADHGQRYVSGTRVPLIFLFPRGEHGGRIAANVQNLDIAPTLLDYIGIERPSWMEGASLIAGEPRPERPIITAGHRWGASIAMKEGWTLDDLKVGPPFYSLGSIGAVVCQRMYDLNLEKAELAVSDVEGHTAPCAESELPPAHAVARLLVEHLAQCGYDTASIRTPSITRN